jgi:hypothetical protein
VTVETLVRKLVGRLLSVCSQEEEKVVEDSVTVETLVRRLVERLFGVRSQEVCASTSLVEDQGRTRSTSSRSNYIPHEDALLLHTVRDVVDYVERRERGEEK